jgi:hypothetical protein
MRFAIQWSQRDDSDLPEFASVARTAHSGRLVRPDRGEKRMPNVILINPFEVPNAPVSGSVTVKMHFHLPEQKIDLKARSVGVCLMLLPCIAEAWVFRDTRVQGAPAAGSPARSFGSMAAPGPNSRMHCLREWTSARVATLVPSAKPYTPTFNHDELEPVKKSKAYRLKFDQRAWKPNHGILNSDMI